MPEAQLLPVNILDNESYRYTRERWMMAGVDNFTTPPAQNPDAMEVAKNVMPPLTNSWLRRPGYTLFTPSLDQGIGTGDQLNPTLLFGVGLDGSSGYVTFPNTYSITANSNLTIEGWIETGTTSGGYIVSLNSHAPINAGDVCDLALVMETSGKISLYYYSSGSASVVLTTSGTYNDGALHYVVATLAGTAAVIYVDGVSVASHTEANGIGAVSTYYWRVGQGPTGGGSGRSFAAVTYLQSFVSHVAVYAYNLTGTQVANHYSMATGQGQAALEEIISVDGPADAWWLTENLRAQPPAPGDIVQNIPVIVSAATTSPAFALPTIPGNTILVIVATDNSVTPTVSDSLSNTYTAICHTSKLHSFYAPITASGVTTLTIAGASSQQIVALCFELSGPISTYVDQTTTASTGTPQSSFSSGTVTTGSNNTVIYSVVYSASRSAGFSTSLTTGSNFATILTSSGAGAGVDAGYTVFLIAAYQSAPTSGTVGGASWTSTSNGTYQGLTFSLLVSAAAAANGTTAFDYVGTDNGTYTGTFFLAVSETL